jgi:D-amino peptidase
MKNGPGLKVYISADMEGIAGVVGREQLVPEGFEYERFREFMTAEVNAAVEAARDAGATDIVVSDSHGNGQNLRLDMLPQDIQLVRSWPRPLGMMQGIDESFDAALFIGYHASAGNSGGIAAHTVSSKAFSSVRIDGEETSEGELNALIAGHFGVPVVMVSGDDAAIEEISGQLGAIEGAIVKWHYSHTSARTLMPVAAQNLIRDKVKAGLARRNEIKPLRPKEQMTLDLTYKKSKLAKHTASSSNVELVDSHRVRFVGNIIEISEFIETACG